MKIIVCSTFRDFTGSSNDQLQYMFLDSIKKQTYTDFTFVATTFREQHVSEVITKYFDYKGVVIDTAIPEEYKFSLSDVIYNGIKIAEQIQESSIIVWCTCDIQLNPSFFQTIIDNFQPGTAGIIHPNINYSTYQDLLDRKGKVADLVTGGIDIMFFDSSILIKAKEDIIKYRFYDWGFFEYFLVELSTKYAKHRINLFSLSKIKKVMNDRCVTNESTTYFDNCTAINYPTLKKYVSDNKLHNGVDAIMQYRAHKLYSVINKDMFYQYILYKHKLNSFINAKLPSLKTTPIYRILGIEDEIPYNK